MSEAKVDASRLILNDSARTIGEFDDVAASSNVVVGDVFSGILRWAEEIDADLIVVGPHRRQFRDAFIGTTAERTIAHSQRPVLMARSEETTSELQSLMRLSYAVFFLKKQKAPDFIT